MTELAKPARMYMVEARELVDQINSGIENIGATLVEIYEREGYKALGYDKFDTFIRSEFHSSLSTAYRLMKDSATRRQIQSRIETRQLGGPDVAEKVVQELPSNLIQRISSVPDESREHVIDQSLSVNPVDGVVFDILTVKEEITKSRPKDTTPAKPVEAVVKDGADREVLGEPLQRIFTTVRPEFARLHGLLNEVLREARTLTQNDRDDGVYLSGHMGDLGRSIDQAASIIRFTAPYAVCPADHAWGEACEVCRSVGFVTKPMWDKLSKDMTHR